MGKNICKVLIFYLYFSKDIDKIESVPQKYKTPLTHCLFSLSTGLVSNVIGKKEMNSQGNVFSGLYYFKLAHSTHVLVTGNDSKLCRCCPASLGHPFGFTTLLLGFSFLPDLQLLFPCSHSKIDFLCFFCLLQKSFIHSPDLAQDLNELS